MKYYLYLILVVIVFFGIGMWTADRDKKVEQASARYELCVHNQYGMSPAQWYEEQGQYPVCDPNAEK